MCNVLMACVPTLIYGHKLWLAGKNRTRVAKVDGLKVSELKVKPSVFQEGLRVKMVLHS